jgi:hypothetical protein
MPIPNIIVIQHDQSPVRLHYNKGIYRQSVNILTVFNPQCLEIDPKKISTYEEITPYVKTTKNITWLLIGLSLGLLTNLIGNPAIWSYAIVIFTFALASIIFGSHSPARHKLYQMTLEDGQRFFSAIEIEYLAEIERQFPNAEKIEVGKINANSLTNDEELHVEQMQYGIVTTSASGSIILLSNQIVQGNNYQHNLGSMLAIGMIIILIGLVAVSICKIVAVEIRKKQMVKKK